MRVDRIILSIIFLMSLAPACRHRPDSIAKLHGLELPGIDGAPARVLFEDRGKVHVRGCPATFAVPPAGVVAKVQCNIDLNLAPIAVASYKSRLAKSLSVRSTDVMTKSEIEVERNEEALAKLQKSLLDIRLAGRVDDGTIVPEILRAEAHSLDLRAKLVAARSRSFQFDRIMKSLKNTTSTRFFGPGIDQQAALAPFEPKKSHDRIIAQGSCVKRNDLGMVFCEIPAGRFIMGAPANEGNPAQNREEQPEHQVVLTSDFELMATEVTQAMWMAVMVRNPSPFIAPGNPVEKVTYEEVTLEFLPRLNARLKSDGYLYRLPTEAEWEYACRARQTGNYGIDGDSKTFAWLLGNSERETSTVARLRPNGFGLFDMHGNVRELVQDAFAAYEADPVSDPVIADGDGQISRGGGWRDPDGMAKCATRGLAIANLRDEGTGFRLVRVR